MQAKSILLVEDYESDIELTRRAFAKCGIVNPFIVAEDGQEALDYLFGTGKHIGRDRAILPSLVLLDLKVPKIDGLSVLMRIRAEPLTHRLPVVILSTSIEGRDLAQAYDLGVNSYVRKPVNFDHFANVVEQLRSYWLVLNQAPPMQEPT